MVEEQNPETTTILVVEDNAVNLLMLKRILERAGYAVVTAETGQQALDIVGEAQPDMILLDIMMPGMDGYATCERLKAEPSTRDVPVIFISAITQVQDKVRAFGAGGVDYIPKPFQVQEVLARVRAHLEIQDLQQQLRQANAELAAHNQELQEALDQVRTLSGLLPICAGCKKIRDDSGYWEQVEVYVQRHVDVQFSHGLCPDCMVRLYPEIYGDGAPKEKKPNQGQRP